MRTYIKIWVIITLIADIAVFGFLTAKREDIFKCNRTYKKIYPCYTSPIVLKSIDELEDLSYSSSTYENDYVPPYKREEPGLVEDEVIQSDLPDIFGIMLGVDLVIAGTAILLYFIIANMADRRAALGSLFSIALVAFVIGCGYAFTFVSNLFIEPAGITEIHYNAPIIYLYDEQEREANVKLDLNGELTCTYPKYDETNGWTVKTSADGVLTDRNGRQYEYLYWEADVDMDPDFSKGFCVKGEDSAAFLEKALSDLGLSDTEANAFIMYWLPDLEENPYNVIAFQTDAYEEVAKLVVDPLPDTVVRVNMLFYGSDEYVEMEAQELSAMNPSLEEREGFVLVEWGGGKLG